MAIDDWHRRLRVCIHSKVVHFKHSLWTDDINFVNLCHFQFNFYLTITVLHTITSFIQNRACKAFTPAFVLQGCAAAELRYGGRFYLYLGADNCCVKRRKNIKIAQKLSKLQLML